MEERNGTAGRKGRVEGRIAVATLPGGRTEASPRSEKAQLHPPCFLSFLSSYICRLISVRLSTQIKSPGAPLKLSEIDKKDLGREADVRLTSVVYIWQQPAVI